MRYRKIATIEAFQYDGTFPLAVLGDDMRVRSAGDGTGACEIVTLEGVHRCDIGDWIASGVNGELWPIKPDIFAKSYVPDTAAPRTVALKGEREIAEAIFQAITDAGGFKRKRAVSAIAARTILARGVAFDPGTLRRALAGEAGPGSHDGSGGRSAVATLDAKATSKSSELSAPAATDHGKGEGK